MDPLVEEFGRHLSLERGLALNTCRSYLLDLKDFSAYLTRRFPGSPLQAGLKGADVRVIADYLWHLSSEKKLRPASIFRRMEALKSFYRYLLLEEKISQDPTLHLHSPKLPERIPKFLREEEVQRLLQAAQGRSFRQVRLRAISELLYATGIRASELLTLRLDAVHLKEGWVRVTGKGGKERIIPIHDRSRRVVEDYLHLRQSRFDLKTHAPEVFLSSRGRVLSRSQLWREIKHLAKKAGLSQDVFPHLLRHSFASHLLQHGADLRSVQEFLGHSSISTTQIYTHLEKSGLKNSHRKFHPRG